MPTSILKNFTIEELKDKNVNPYYLIINQDNPSEVYFCFKWEIKEGWEDLGNKNILKQIKEIELEYKIGERGNRKVTNVWTGLEFLL